MKKAELLAQLDKLQYRWTLHRKEHAIKRSNNAPDYNLFDHGVASGYCKALNSFKDMVSKLEEDKK